MRGFAPLLTFVLLAALAPSGAGAAVSIDLVFVEVNASKITETSGVVVTPGDSVLMEVRLVTTEPLTFVSYSLQFDDVLGADQLDVSGVAEWDGVVTANACTVFQEIFTPIAPGVVVDESVGSLPGTIKSFDGASITVTLPGGTYVMGTVAWSTTFLVGTATVESGVFATGIDLIADASLNDITASTTFNSATISVPAPLGFNVDLGTIFGTPGTGYGAASGLVGSWNLAGLGVTALVDATGAASGASVNVAASTDGGNTGITPTNDDELLFNDNVFSTSGASWSADLAGLAAGEYEVYLYAPSHGAVPSGDMSVGGTAVPSIPGHTGSTLIEGTSWLRVPATVTAGSLAITGASTGLAGLAGLQVVFLPEPGQLRQLASGMLALLLLFIFSGRGKAVRNARA